MFDRIPDITAQRAMLKPDAVAFRDLALGITLTYRQLEHNVQLLAGFLRAGGVGEGDRIAVLCRNRVEFFELLFACGKLGAILVPLNWRMPTGELAPLVDDAAPKFLFFGDEDADVAGELGGDSTTAVGLDDESPSGYLASRDVCLSVPGEHPDPRPSPAADARFTRLDQGSAGQSPADP